MDVLKIMIDAVKGNAMENYTKGQTSEAIRNALIEMNGGSKKINPKTFHRGSEMYALVEELISVIIDEGFKDTDAIFNLVEYKNIADGDEQGFYVEDNSLFVVANSAAGIKGIRRQRIDNGHSVTVDTVLKSVRVYEDLNRLLAGKTSFDQFVNKVAASIKAQTLSDAYAAIEAISATTEGLSATYVVSGTQDGAEPMLDALIAHVEAATGKAARIYGTKAALKKIKTAVVADEAKSDLYNMGYYGKYNGTEMVALRQAHKPGTETFALNDSKLYILAGDDRPIKIVNEGDGILYEGDPLSNADLTQEYFFGQPMGVAVVCAEKFGVFTFSD